MLQGLQGFSNMRAAAATSLCLLTVASACGDDAATPRPDAAVDAPADAPPPCLFDGPSISEGSDAPVTLSTNVLPLLEICANAECHGNRAGGLDLSAGHQYLSLVGRPAGECSDGRAYVDPGHSERSYLVDKLRGKTCQCSGERMPLGGPYLSYADIATVRRWIDEGAPND
jgi:hypothetical protein